MTERKVVQTRRAAEKGDAEAQYRLGDMHARGKGVPRDKVEAHKWFTLAGQQGHADAQCQLGWMYDLGDGVPRDCAEAAKWYRKAAEQGDARAQYHLGVVYSNGIGVAVDCVEAYKWFSLADADDTPDRLAFIRTKMKRPQIAEAERLVRESRPKRAQ